MSSSVTIKRAVIQKQLREVKYPIEKADQFTEDFEKFFGAFGLWKNLVQVMKRGSVQKLGLWKVTERVVCIDER